MSAADKQEAQRILAALPEDASYDEIVREIAFARMIERGLADSDEGGTISHEEMRRRVDA